MVLLHEEVSVTTEIKGATVYKSLITAGLSLFFFFPFLTATPVSLKMITVLTIQPDKNKFSYRSYSEFVLILFSLRFLVSTDLQEVTVGTFCIIAKKKRSRVVCSYWNTFLSLISKSFKIFFKLWLWRNTFLWYKLKVLLISAEEGLSALPFRSWTLSVMPSDEWELETYRLQFFWRAACCQLAVN